MSTKYLTLIRHAQTEDALPGQSDFDRMLTRRGTEDAAEMSRRLKLRGLPAPQLLSSTAARAVATTEIFSRALKIPERNIVRDDRLYTASVNEIFKVLSECAPHIQHVMIVSHNPTLSEFAEKLCGDRELSAMPTCAIITMQFDLHAWSDLQWRSGTHTEFDYPARLA